mmetsp:Transcript_3232/g.4476  ORF Transcript_3232/g.4476 Transcript_3232/m.4476 type:complete len:199 (-) Transcript_3232:85-681(-)
MRSVLLNDILSAAALGAIGDVTTQLVIEKKKTLDTQRLVSITCFNAVYIGGFLHFLYRLFPPIVTQCGIWTKNKALENKGTFTHAIGCSLVDNIHNGSIYIPLYFISIDLAENVSWPDTRKHLINEWFPTYLSCSFFWIPYSAFNFGVITPNRRVKFMAFGNLLWSVFADFILHREKKKKSTFCLKSAVDDSNNNKTI